MKHTIILFVLAFITASDATAQAPNNSHCPPIYQRLLFAGENPTEADQQLAQRRAAQQKEQQFWMKTEKFISSWTALVREYNEKGTFNMKQAKQVSKAFHELEKTEGWPK